MNPFASLVGRVEPGTPRLLVNRDRVGEDVGLDFDGEGSTDALFLGDCDDGAERLARLLGYDIRAAAEAAEGERSTPQAESRQEALWSTLEASGIAPHELVVDGSESAGELEAAAGRADERE